MILQVRLWDIERGECVLILHNSDSFCRCVAFHGNIDQSYTAKIKYSLPGNRIVSGDFDGIVHFWEITFTLPASVVEDGPQVQQYFGDSDSQTCKRCFTMFDIPIYNAAN